MAELEPVNALDNDVLMGDKLLVLNDVLAFVQSNLKLVDKETVEKVTTRYYSINVIREARDSLYARIDSNGQLSKQRSKE